MNPTIAQFYLAVVVIQNCFSEKVPADAKEAILPEFETEIVVSADCYGTAAEQAESEGHRYAEILYSDVEGVSSNVYVKSIREFPTRFTKAAAEIIAQEYSNESEG